MSHKKNLSFVNVINMNPVGDFFKLNLCSEVYYIDIFPKLMENLRNFQEVTLKGSKFTEQVAISVKT